MKNILKSVSHAAGISLAVALFAVGSAVAQSALPMAPLPLAAVDEAIDTPTIAVAVKDFDVYVDLPTRFAFIKTPAAWKFIGQLDDSQMTRLPPGTLTALLQPAPADTALASVAVKTGDLFVDPPTGFAFVKTPQQWKFVGKLDAAQMARLPADTLTTLLPASAEDAPRYAAGNAGSGKF